MAGTKAKKDFNYWHSIGMTFAWIVCTRHVVNCFRVVTNHNTPVAASLLESRFASTKTRTFAQTRPDDAAAAVVAAEPQTKQPQPMPIYRSGVVVHRGRQSMAFRQGSPLVFSGAIAYTSKVTTAGGGEDEHDFDEEQDHSLSVGDLVAVAVNNKDVKRNQNNGKKKRRIKHNDVAPVYPHHVHVLSTRSNSTSTSAVLNTNTTTTTTTTTAGPPPQMIGFGVYNPRSMYRVRILCHETSHPTLFGRLLQSSSPTSEEDDSNLLRVLISAKLSQAVQWRARSLNLPHAATDSFRLFNGEGDGLSGLAVDVLGGRVAVVMSSAAWCQVHKQVIMEELQRVLREEYDKELEVVWRITKSRLEQDGYHDFDQDDDSNDSSSNQNHCVVATESGIRYRTFPYQRGQKTGFYCDQRENRLSLATPHLCRDKRVLDLCCYHGGFALNAFLHGQARRCVGVDSSADAVDAARANAELNGCPEDDVVFCRDDVSNWMRRARDRHEYYDVVVLDPPKLAPTARSLPRAARKYQALNKQAMQMLCPEHGGLLLTCTCSAAMTTSSTFVSTVQQAAVSARRQLTLIRITGAASCHVQCPASWPDGAYLTAALFRVSGAL